MLVLVSLSLQKEEGRKREGGREKHHALYIFIFYNDATKRKILF
jgi:hypothetical protein